MTEQLDRLLALARASGGLGGVANPNAALEARDDRSFEREWLRVYDAVRALREASRASTLGLEKRLDAVAEAAFKSSYATVGHDELAAQVSDDLLLVAGAIVCGYEDAWLSALLDAYRQGEFPQKPLHPLSLRLGEVLATPRHPSSHAQRKDEALTDERLGVKKASARETPRDKNGPVRTKKPAKKKPSAKKPAKEKPTAEGKCSTEKKSSAEKKPTPRKKSFAKKKPTPKRKPSPKWAPTAKEAKAAAKKPTAKKKPAGRRK